MRINRNNSSKTGFKIEKNEIISLDVSMLKGIFRLDGIWSTLISYVRRNFPDNFDYGCSYDGCHHTLVMKGTCDDISLIIKLFLSEYSENKSLHLKQLNRYVTAYLSKVEKRENVQSLESYILANWNRDE